ncbi:GDSL esterase/lipase At5g45960 isoform X1 [Asparagus officinalis]|uniref:GDSL esterase/lipase At5g45960 isoform X1 n=1 Tax=Asparagus officinalis TaxID=4686 RepID=UPI00098E0440|nr:GDSL esterase/lipase At5g45960 isoform X1 [Asparagus officinalis]
MSILTLSSSFLLLLLLLLKLSLQAQAQTNAPKPMNPVSAVFAFGDSTMDPGNNNFIATAFRSDFPPYGRDFFTHLPTGRFTNGKLVTDFAASYVGLKEELPPCLDWSLGIDELMTGVSFASAGSGFDPLTAQIGLQGVIPMPQQLNYFKDYLNKLDFTIGEDKRADIIKRAIFVVSAGTNDFISYSTLPLRRQSFSIEGYQGYILQNLRVLLQGLCDLGAERIVVAGLPPIGCLPVVITLNSKDGIHDRSCIEPDNAVSYDYNRKLQALLQGYSTLRQVRIIYADIYNPLFELIQSPTKYGFENSEEGCCGTGLVEASFLCNPKSLVCLNAAKYVFWDSIHPTEKTYYYIFNSLRVMIDQMLA